MICINLPYLLQCVGLGHSQFPLTNENLIKIDGSESWTQPA